ncbi:MAG TPA: SGNH/GDSL hydrolase family protein [Flavipsychrobacter sp.]|nr:SGNH/GDSL hydrolase family protein [Flavipsychrobacter sp.]
MYTYLALGDSYTIGEQVPLQQNFPYQTVALLREKNIEVADPVIVAKTGWTTDELAMALREEGIKETFSFVTLLIGVNNQYRGRALDNYKEEFTQLLDQAIVFANGHTQNVFVLSIPDWGVTPFAHDRDARKIAEDIDAYNNANKDISLAYRCNYLDITDSTRKNGANSDFLAADGLHPSAEEYQIWAKRLAPLVEKMLKG